MAQTSIRSFFAPIPKSYESGKKHILDEAETKTQRKLPKLSQNERLTSREGHDQAEAANVGKPQDIAIAVPTKTEADATTTPRNVSQLQVLKRYTDLPLKDPKRHSVGKTTVWEGFPCPRNELMELRERNENYLQTMQERETVRKLDKVVHDLQRKLEAGEQIPLQDIRAGAWYLSCPEYFEQYLGWENEWHAVQLNPEIRFVDVEDDEANCPQVSAEILITHNFEPCGDDTWVFDAPAFASLDPVIVEDMEIRTEYKIWFLGDGYLRMEQDMREFTGRPGKLLWDGFQVVPPPPKKKKRSRKRVEAN